MTKRKPAAFKISPEQASSLNNDTASPQKQETKKKQSRPRKPKAVTDQARILPISDAVANQDIAEFEVDPPVRDHEFIIPWFSLFMSAIASLFLLWLSLSVETLITELFDRHDWLGWGATGLTIIAVLALAVLLIREIWALFRMRTLNKIRERSDRAWSEKDLKAARNITRELTGLYARYPNTASGRAALQDHSREIVDGDSLIEVAETELMANLDAEARNLILNSAKRVSLVTAISPRALIDIAYVAMENMRLAKEVSKIYGGRPGLWNFFRLFRNVIIHLAATGAIAVGDGIIQQFVGHGVAAKLSSRLGEGVVNGLLTVRIGISAMDLCRPLSFRSRKRPAVSDFLADLAGFGSEKEIKGKS